jgi:hypothetical protein
MFWVPLPPAADQPAQGSAPHTAVEIEVVAESFRPQVSSELLELVAGSELDYSIDVWVMTQQWRELLLGGHGEVAIRMSGLERPQQGGNEDDVPDGTEANGEYAGRWRCRSHGGNLGPGMGAGPPSALLRWPTGD